MENGPWHLPWFYFSCLCVRSSPGAGEVAAGLCQLAWMSFVWGAGLGCREPGGEGKVLGAAVTPVLEPKCSGLCSAKVPADLVGGLRGTGLGPLGPVRRHPGAGLGGSGGLSLHASRGCRCLLLARMQRSVDDDCGSDAVPAARCSPNSRQGTGALYTPLAHAFPWLTPGTAQVQPAADPHDAK